MKSALEQILICERQRASLIYFLRAQFKIIYFYEHLGNENWDLDIGILAKNSLELREFILELRENFGKFIKINDLYIVVEESKGNYAPEGVFN